MRLESSPCSFRRRRWPPAFLLLPRHPPRGGGAGRGGDCPGDGFHQAEAFEARPGGAATSGKPVDANAVPARRGRPPLQARARLQGRHGAFRKLWVSAPSSTQLVGRARAAATTRAPCQSCHLKDGRAASGGRARRPGRRARPARRRCRRSRGRCGWRSPATQDDVRTLARPGLRRAAPCRPSASPGDAAEGWMAVR